MREMEKRSFFFYLDQSDVELGGAGVREFLVLYQLLSLVYLYRDFVIHGSRYYCDPTGIVHAEIEKKKFFTLLIWWNNYFVLF